MRYSIKCALLKAKEDVLFVTSNRKEVQELQKLGLSFTSYIPFVRGYHKKYYYVNKKHTKEFEKYVYPNTFLEVRYYESSSMPYLYH